jgi:hypothetical protein
MQEVGSKSEEECRRVRLLEGLWVQESEGEEGCKRGGMQEWGGVQGG